MAQSYPSHRSLNWVWDIIALDYVAMTQPGGGTGGAGDASAANQVLGNASLTSIDGKLGLLGQKVMATSAPVVIASDQSALPVTGTFWQGTQPVSGPLTDTQLRASAVAVSGTFWQTTQPVSGTVTANAGTNLNTSALALDATLTGGTQKAIARGGAKGATAAADVTGTAEGADHQAVDVQIYHGGATKDPTQIRALTSADVVTTAPPSNASTNVAQFGGTNVSTGTGAGGAGIPRVTVSNDSNVLVTPPTLTKGTQGATGFSTQDLKDSGRVNIAWTAELVPAATTEGLITITESLDGGATTTFTSKVITSGKRLRLTSVSFQVENTLGASLQRCYLRMRVNTAGTVTTGSPLQGTWAAQAAGTVKSISTPVLEEFPDGFEILGNGTKQIGFTAQGPDWVSATSTLKVYITIFGYEY